MLISTVTTLKAFLKGQCFAPSQFHTTNSLLDDAFNDPEHYPHCDWLKISYCTNKITLCKYAAGTTLATMFLWEESTNHMPRKRVVSPPVYIL